MPIATICSCAARSWVRARRRDGSRDAATRRRAVERAPARDEAAYDPAGRSLRGTAARPPRPRSAGHASGRRCRAPNPIRCPRLLAEPRERRGRARRSRFCAAASTSSLSAHAAMKSSGVSSLPDGRRERIVIAAEAVHQDRASPSRRTGSRFPGRRRWHRAMMPSINVGGLGFPATQCRERERGVRRDAGSGRLLDGLHLRHQHRRARESPPNATAWPHALSATASTSSAPESRASWTARAPISRQLS